MATKFDILLEEMAGVCLTELTVSGIRFKTGLPVTFTYVRNTVSSKNFITKEHGKRFQTDIEPAGRYMNQVAKELTKNLPSGWETGTQHFNNPLVIKLNSGHGGGSLYDENSWKAHLYRAFKAKGKALSAKMKKFGYDGIVTIDGKDTSEIVAL